LQVFQSAIDHVRAKQIPITLGVGAVVDPGTASVFMNMGANFIVSPVNNPEVAKVCNRRKVACIPGCGSVNEISAAEELGAEIVKIFPGLSVGGPQFVKDLLGPLPWSNVMPAGGVDVTEESIAAWFKAGVCAIGMGSRLITKELLAQHDFERISQQVEFSLRIIRAVRGT
jgi:2-dehydro-3-deoxyphosphogluconate aldolase / (4S)-4-hydroxy-2-oxoglutarate aldolase